MTVIHQGRILATDQYHVRIPLHTHLSAIPITTVGDVTKKLKMVLPPELIEFLTIEVIQAVSPTAQCSSRTHIPADALRGT